MKNLVLVFNNMREADYHFKNLKNGEVENSKKINIIKRETRVLMLEYYDNSRFNFIQRLFGKKEFKYLTVIFTSKNSNLVGNNAKKIFIKEDMETQEIFEIIKKEM